MEIHDTAAGPQKRVVSGPVAETYDLIAGDTIGLRIVISGIEVHHTAGRP